MQTPADSRFQSVYSIVFLIGFLIVSILPLANPGLSLDTINSDFQWRGTLIGWFNQARFALGDRAFGSIVRGKDGWMYFLGEQTLGNYQRTAQWDGGDLKNLQQGLDALNARLQAQGSTLLVVVAPDKSSIYSQYMPPEIPVIGKTSLYDQLLNYLARHGKTRILDLRPALINASKSQQVYYKTDTHWNIFGAFVAYQSVLQELSRSYPQLEPRPFSQFILSPPQNNTRDMARILEMPGLQEITYSLVPKDENLITHEVVPLGSGRDLIFSASPNSQLPSVLILHDSFFGPVVPLLEPSFSRTLSVFYTGSNPPLWNAGWIDQAKPDIVIIELVERDISVNPWPLQPAP